MDLNSLRVDLVGSLLRPEKLKQAFSDYGQVLRARLISQRTGRGDVAMSSPNNAHITSIDRVFDV